MGEMGRWLRRRYAGGEMGEMGDKEKEKNKQQTTNNKQQSIDCQGTSVNLCLS